MDEEAYRNFAQNLRNKGKAAIPAENEDASSIPWIAPEPEGAPLDLGRVETAAEGDDVLVPEISSHLPGSADMEVSLAGLMMQFPDNSDYPLQVPASLVVAEQTNDRAETYARIMEFRRLDARASGLIAQAAGAGIPYPRKVLVNGEYPTDVMLEKLARLYRISFDIPDLGRSRSVNPAHYEGRGFNYMGPASMLKEGDIPNNGGEATEADRAAPAANESYDGGTPAEAAVTELPAVGFTVEEGPVEEGPVEEGLVEETAIEHDLLVPEAASETAAEAGDYRVGEDVAPNDASIADTGAVEEEAPVANGVKTQDDASGLDAAEGGSSDDDMPHQPLETGDGQDAASEGGNRSETANPEADGETRPEAVDAVPAAVSETVAEVRSEAPARNTVDAIRRLRADAADAREAESVAIEQVRRLEARVADLEAEADRRNGERNAMIAEMEALRRRAEIAEAEIEAINQALS